MFQKKRYLLFTLFSQGELLGRLPWCLPHALQLGHRGADFQQSLNLHQTIFTILIDDQDQNSYKESQQKSILPLSGPHKLKLAVTQILNQTD